MGPTLTPCFLLGELCLRQSLIIAQGRDALAHCLKNAL